MVWQVPMTIISREFRNFNRLYDCGVIRQIRSGSVFAGEVATHSLDRVRIDRGSVKIDRGSVKIDRGSVKIDRR